MQIAEQHVVAGAPDLKERFFDGSRAIYPQALGREAFLEKHAKAFFVVEDENGTALERIGWRPDAFR